MTLIFMLFLKSLVQYSDFVLLIWCFCPGTLIILLLYFKPNSFSKICLRVYYSGPVSSGIQWTLQYVHLVLFWKFFGVTVLNTASIRLFCFSSSETTYLHAGPSFLTFCFIQYLSNHFYFLIWLNFLGFLFLSSMSLVKFSFEFIIP